MPLIACFGHKNLTITDHKTGKLYRIMPVGRQSWQIATENSQLLSLFQDDIMNSAGAVAKLASAGDLKSSVREDMWVRVPPAPNNDSSSTAFVMNQPDDCRLAIF